MAIERNVAMVCGAPSAGSVRELKSRFLVMRDESIYIEAFPDQGALVDAIIASKDSITVTFRSGVMNVEFHVRILDRLKAYQLNATTRIEALRLSLPTAIKTVQRRGDYRATVSPNAELEFTCHRIGEKDDLAAVPQPAQKMHIVIRDISVTGLGAIWYRKKEDPSTLANSQRLRIGIKSPDFELLLEGRICHASRLHEPELVRIGVRFQINSASIPDRHKLQQLQKLMVILQRLQLRRGASR